MSNATQTPRFEAPALQLWLSPAELRRAQARTVMARLEARKLDKRLMVLWAEESK